VVANGAALDPVINKEIDPTIHVGSANRKIILAQIPAILIKTKPGIARNKS
jgi:hypothetical protein